MTTIEHMLKQRALHLKAADAIADAVLAVQEAAAAGVGKEESDAADSAAMATTTPVIAAVGEQPKLITFEERHRDDS
ncbi:MAG: hypothetical protein P4M01_08390 [Acidobacteriota bacterium]|nr:hypothetical protein [Acidobacteriota bacterium]